MNLELHKKLALTAKKLIEQHGRTVSIIKNSETFDSETPWISTQTPHENGMSLQLKGVFVNPKSLNSYGFSNEISQNNSSQNGSLIKQKKYLLVAEDSVQEAYQNYLENPLNPLPEQVQNDFQNELEYYNITLIDESNDTYYFFGANNGQNEWIVFRYLKESPYTRLSGIEINNDSYNSLNEAWNNRLILNYT